MIEIKVVETQEEKEKVKEIIENYHSYVPTYKSVGRRIDWLVYYENRIVGMIGVGSSVYPPPKDMLKKIGVNKSSYRKIFNTIANNWRFCMKEKIPNAGTMILKKVREQSRIEWQKKYGNKLDYLITFVGGGNNGAVYLADNWEQIGFTSGLPSHKSSSMKWNDKEELKTLFVKPTGENKKIIFFKDLRTKKEKKEKKNERINTEALACL